LSIDDIDRLEEGANSMEEVKKVEAETPPPIPNLASLDLSNDVSEKKAVVQPPPKPKALPVVESKLSLISRFRFHSIQEISYYLFKTWHMYLVI